MCQNEVVADLKQGKPSMDKITRMGMDTSKKVFQLHGVGEAERPILRKQLRREQMLVFFGKLPPTKIGIEACGAAHHWARELTKLGHEVVLIAAQHAKRYVKRNKNDPADAAALCEAMSRPDMTFVPVKTADQQAALMLAGMRERFVARRTQIANMIRGYAAEFGVVEAKGLDKIELLLLSVLEDVAAPPLARALFETLAQEFAFACRQLEQLEARMMAWHKGDAMSRRLAEIEGVGPIGASLMVMKTPAPRQFKSARHYPAWIGMTPKDHSTAGKQKLGAITHAGDEMLRSVLVAGAMSVCKIAKRKPERVSPWLRQLVARKPLKLAAVALANKNARIAWKMMVTGEAYDAARSRRPALPPQTQAAA
jgi:transposase